MTDLPPPGWYDDPTGPAKERWWDGTQWSDQTRRKGPDTVERPPGDLRSVSDFLSHTMTLIRARWDDFLLVAVIGGVLIGLIGALLLRPVAAGIEIINDELVGWKGSYTVQVGIFLVAALGVYVVTTIAHCRLAWGAAADREGGWATAVQYAFAAVPRFVGWILLSFLPVVAFGGVFILLVFAGGAVAGFVALAGLMWWSLIVSFVPVVLVSQPRGTNPIETAFAVVKGRWWRIFGRFLLVQLIAGLVFQVIAAIVNQVLGLNVLGFELVDAGNNQIDIVKDVGGPLQFFIGAAVMTVLSLVANVAQIAGATSIVGDVEDLDLSDPESRR